MNENFFSFKANLINGEPFNFEDLKGKVTLVVNTASKCGFTSQYAGLEDLHKKYHANGLEILGFPCDQFGNQEPGSNEEVASFCRLNYQTEFKLFEKVKVNGDDAHPLFIFLQNSLTGFITNSIKWNFTKFLIDPDGNPIKRYAPTVAPASIEGDIKNLLESKA